MKKVELLYPEYCNIYGESYNIEYLGRCNSEIEVIKTNNNMRPAFVDSDVDMIYLGCSPERKQEHIIELLLPYKDRLVELIEKGTIVLATGNAIEVFAKEIHDAERVIPALGIFDFTATRYMNRDRHNSQYVGTFTTDDGEEITMLGHRSQFSFAYGDFSKLKWLDINIGIGMNKDTKDEGIHYKNFFGTYSLGPCFIMNPLFAKYILRKLGLNDALLFEKEIIEAYEYRKDELNRTLSDANNH